MRNEGDHRRDARRALLLDAVASALMGVLLVAFAGVLTDPLGLSVGLMRGAGLVLLPYAAAVGLAAGAPSERAVTTIISCNAVWVLASVSLLVSGWIAPSTAGTAFILAQAAAVALFAVLQRASLRPLRARLAA